MDMGHPTLFFVFVCVFSLTGVFVYVYIEKRYVRRDIARLAIKLVITSSKCMFSFSRDMNMNMISFCHFIFVA